MRLDKLLTKQKHALSLCSPSYWKLWVICRGENRPVKNVHFPLVISEKSWRDDCSLSRERERWTVESNWKRVETKSCPGEEEKTRLKKKWIKFGYLSEKVTSKFSKPWEGSVVRKDQTDDDINNGEIITPPLVMCMPVWVESFLLLVPKQKSHSSHSSSLKIPRKRVYCLECQGAFNIWKYS